MTEAELAENIPIVREIEIEWLSEALGRSIANLGYPVGCGVAPHPEQMRKAAGVLFDRYLKMIEMARRAGKADPVHT